MFATVDFDTLYAFARRARLRRLSRILKICSGVNIVASLEAGACRKLGHLGSNERAAPVGAAMRVARTVLAGADGAAVLSPAPMYAVPLSLTVSTLRTVRIFTPRQYARSLRRRSFWYGVSQCGKSCGWVGVTHPCVHLRNLEVSPLALAAILETASLQDFLLRYAGGTAPIRTAQWHAAPSGRLSASRRASPYILIDEARARSCAETQAGEQ